LYRAAFQEMRAMDEDDDDLLIVARNSPATDTTARVLRWLGFLVALGLLVWAVLYALG
jgi:hypothetical protein